MVVSFYYPVVKHTDMIMRSSQIFLQNISDPFQLLARPLGPTLNLVCSRSSTRVTPLTNAPSSMPSNPARRGAPQRSTTTRRSSTEDGATVTKGVPVQVGVLGPLRTYSKDFRLFFLYEQRCYAIVDPFLSVYCDTFCIVVNKGR